MEATDLCLGHVLRTSLNPKSTYDLVLSKLKAVNRWIPFKDGRG
jgi:hypothetical protein